MKNHLVRSLINFTDIEDNAFRKKGDEFYVDMERYEFLKEHKAVELIEVKMEEVEILPKPVKKTSKKKKAQ